MNAFRDLHSTSRPFALALLLALSVVGTATLRAQDAAPAPTSAAVATAPDGSTLPPASRTEHVLAISDRTLRFTATAGSLPALTANGPALGEIGYVSYVLEGANPAERPVTFAINGGPGAASAWLHIGAMGPWRLPLQPGPSPAATLQANAETWLDFTDLVFLDPTGTGYSRTFGPVPQPRGPDRRRRGDAAEEPSPGPAPARPLWTVNGDILALTGAIQRWLGANGRTGSPRMLVGESYGGFRAPRIAALMQRRKLPFDALVIVSPVLDFEGRRFSFGPMPFVNALPAIAAVEIERRGGSASREALAAIEAYARGDYLQDLMRGPRNDTAKARMISRIVELTGLPEAFVRERGGRISGFNYAREAPSADGRQASAYDATVLAEQPTGERPREDPFIAAMTRPLTDAMNALYRDRLDWRVDRPYELQSGDVLRGWQWQNSPYAHESMSSLATVLTDSGTRVLVAHGLHDLVTPYFAAALQLDQLSYSGSPDRVRLKTYPGGHMFYSRDASRSEFRLDARELLLGDRPPIASP